VARRQFLAGALALAITFGGTDEMSSNRERHKDDKDERDDPQPGHLEPREGEQPDPPTGPETTGVIIHDRSEH
jgi:hypothetical protein